MTRCCPDPVAVASTLTIEVPRSSIPRLPAVKPFCPNQSQSPAPGVIMVAKRSRDRLLGFFFWKESAFRRRGIQQAFLRTLGARRHRHYELHRCRQWPSDAGSSSSLKKVKVLVDMACLHFFFFFFRHVATFVRKKRIAR